MQGLINKFKKLSISGKPKKKSYTKPVIKKTVIKSKIPNYLKDGHGKGDFTNVKSFSPFPNKYFAKMLYGENLTLTTGTAGVYGTEYVFRLNSLYDPDFTGTGHQPYGHDQMIALYRRYLVTAVNFILNFVDPSEDGLIVAAAIQPSNSTFSLTGKNTNEIKEKPQCVTRVLSNSGEQRTTIQQYMPLHRLEGLHKVQWLSNLADYAALSGANPNVSPYLRVAVASARGTGGATVMLRPLIKFYTQWYDRVTLSQS